MARASSTSIKVAIRENTSEHVSFDDIISCSPDVQSGTPVFSGTRVPVQNLFDYLIGGDDVSEFLVDFPSVQASQVAELLDRLGRLGRATPKGQSIAA